MTLSVKIKFKNAITMFIIFIKFNFVLAFKNKIQIKRTLAKPEHS